MSKTIEIKKVHICNLLFSFIVGFGILFFLEHFGNFTFNHEYVKDSNAKPSFTTEIPYSTKISKIKYNTYFENIVETNGNGFTFDDVSYSDSKFNKYSSKSYYYTQAMFRDFKYGMLISLLIFLITLIYNNFKIKITQ